MSRLRLVMLALAMVSTTALAQGASPARPVATPAVDKGKLSYAMGYQIGSQFASGNGPDVDMAVVIKALQDGYNRRAPAVSMQQMHDQLTAFDAKMHNDALAEFQRIAVVNARKSEQYLARNKTQPGVVSLPSGIQYAVIKAGNGGLHPRVDSTVTVNYRGALIDGTEFDSSWAHGNPVTITVNRVIRGWQDVIPRMQVGDTWRVVIPPALAYGDRGELPRIGPNETLVFEIELLEIKP
jgi:FKBP-type peptidyl-prolyl cis-trans isomerase FklB